LRLSSPPDLRRWPKVPWQDSNLRPGCPQFLTRSHRAWSPRAGGGPPLRPRCSVNRPSWDRGVRPPLGILPLWGQTTLRSVHQRMAWYESRGASSLPRHLGSRIEAPRSGRETLAGWPTRRSGRTRRLVLLRAIAVFVLCASLLVACGGGGGGYGGGGGGGASTTATTTVGSTTTTTTGTTTTTSAETTTS
jgi:hypothetical protein